jgi:hypothetical protein
MTSEIDDQVETDTTPYIYQASISFLQPCNDIVLLKAQNKEQALKIIEEGFSDAIDLKIHSISLSQEQPVKSFLNKTSN